MSKKEVAKADLKEYRAQNEDCPHCGRCKHCGRGGYEFYPRYWYYPNYPSTPWYTTTNPNPFPATITSSSFYVS